MTRFTLAAGAAIGQISDDIGSAQGEAMNNYYTTFVAKTPKVFGVVAKSIYRTKNGRRTSAAGFLNAKAHDVLGVASAHPAVLKLDQGTYTNPGNVHWSPVNTGILVSKAGFGFNVIRTDPSGFSNKAKKGMSPFARTAFARTFRGVR